MKKLDYDDVLIVPNTGKVSSRRDVNLSVSYQFKNGTVFKGIPIMASNMDGVGTINMAKALASHGMFTCLRKAIDLTVLEMELTENPQLADFCAMTIGVDGQNFPSRIRDKLKYVCYDAANGYTNAYMHGLKKLREIFDGVIIAGNVVTPDRAYALVDAGADIIKVGIGPGSCCTTRLKTGVGYPQLSAVGECAVMVDPYDSMVVADGGCNNPGDVAKAFASGAGFVMLGNLLAGHEEGGGQIFKGYDKNGKMRKMVNFYGMASETANNLYNGGLQDYRTDEGREVVIPFKSSLNDTIHDILGGLRSACSYVGAANLSDMSVHATFVECHKTHNTVFT